MEDPSHVAMLNCVQNLKKNGPRLVVVVEIITLLGDFREQIAFRAILKNNESAIWRVQDLLH
jgi:hypothetical protein